MSHGEPIKIVRVTRPDEMGAIADAASAESVPSLSDAGWALRPQTHLVALGGDTRIRARCSLWRREAGDRDGPLGIIGHFAAADADAAGALLDRACDELAASGCVEAVGPMDRDTWHAYRLVVETSDEPPYFLELDTPPDYVDHFASAGFTPIARYCSAVDPAIERSADVDVDALAREAGVRVEPMTGPGDDALREIHAVSLAAFASNFLYTPIAEDEFLGMYRPILAHVRPELVRLVRDEDRMVGFLFAVPDMLELQRTGATGTVIIKSMAVHPAWQGRGIGRLLFRSLEAAAVRAGFTRAIHALMHESNRSLHLSREVAGIIRRYALFGRELPR